ncbi:bifunctional sugar-binding transcriptional regulator/dihydroxyacetone kinase subunit DhaK [Lichenihabitans sp. Uapishka_5]|uniref:bifunctional sugar-binding transcriptional regulator/dihydroxyacetone kinase subunit DhaK n=1 Tax=Lichenihabitans sp. Uapishka_5 TaxID=3037302 RepID=UPI0029E8122E|nr:bifunctional sugar-binding transcriptional regulator/dihydroxyacetone kinase subunit DhaK [Lichenihabitans sp. Uapishka_5]MDX7950241.1 bifunctional sugar-binding transcriptional regulator/dihydroxyacetone kinase subunit DhaK [Lichenihabitans sp. Uapishka_5]
MSVAALRKGRPALGAASGPSPDVPLRFGDDPFVWACWLYYEDRLTQGEIADVMGISRATVNSYLAEARERGIVNISLDPKRLAALSVAEELKRHFGLHDCFIIPDDGAARPAIERLGAAGAQVLARMVRSGDVVAAVWGRTVLSVAKHLRVSGLQDVTVVQATGGMAADVPYTPERCATALAEALHGRMVPIAAPAIVADAAVRRLLIDEPLVKQQLTQLRQASRAVLGVSSLRPESTLHASGFFDAVSLTNYLARNAVGVVAGRFIDAQGRPVTGPLDERMIGLELPDLQSIDRRIAVAGGFDKVPAILAALRGRLVNVLVTDAATGQGILNADGAARITGRSSVTRLPAEAPAAGPRLLAKKFLNDPDDVVDEMLDGAIAAHRTHLTAIKGTRRAFRAIKGPRTGKVGLVIGGGAGHEPCFLGYVGHGMADAVAVGNVFSSPPPDPIVCAAHAASGGAGVLLVHGNYAGDIMNFEMAADRIAADGIEVRTVVTTDDVASSPIEDRQGRRGTAGNVFVFKIAGAACDLGLPLERCEALARKANARTFSVGVALEPCAMPHTRRYNFTIGPDEMEMGVGIHGEPGIVRQSIGTADQTVDAMMDPILAEMVAARGDRVAVLVNGFGATPLMELYLLFRRVSQRLTVKNIDVAASLVGSYCTALDMAGASISLLHLDDELAGLLQHPCDTPAWRTGTGSP